MDEISYFLFVQHKKSLKALTVSMNVKYSKPVRHNKWVQVSRKLIDVLNFEIFLSRLELVFILKKTALSE